MLGEETIKTILRDFGLTEKESEIYICLAKQGTMNRTEIARLLNKDKAQILRILKKLQRKGVVELTLEYPRRFTTIPFETLIDSSIKTKREEATFIENAKKDLLQYMKKSQRAQLEISPEKFVVIEGKQRIYAKISDMVNKTKNHFFAISPVSSLVHTDEFNLLDVASDQPLKSKIRYRFLTELTEQNLNVGKALMKKKIGFLIRGRNPNLGSQLFPRMVIRDHEEIMLFIKSRIENEPSEKEETVLWTNCVSIINSFECVFKELWGSSTSLRTRIAEIELGKPTMGALNISDAKTAEQKYKKILNEAEKEIAIVISAKRLVKLWQNASILKERAKRGVAIKIMTSITRENLEVAQKLSEFCRVKHIAANYRGTTIVDGKCFFQFKMPKTDDEETDNGSPPFEGAFYSDELEYASKVKTTLENLWEKAHTPHLLTKESITQSSTNLMLENNSYTHSRADSPYRKMVIPSEEKPRLLSEKDILAKIMHAKKHSVKNPQKDKAVFYGSRGASVIHPPEHFNLTEMIISVSHWNDKSTFGNENWLTINLLQNTQNGDAFVPVAIVKDRNVGFDILQGIYAGTPAAKNIQVFNENEFQVRLYGCILFAGWTKSIPLLPLKYTLPPSCIMFEGFGEVKPGVIRSGLPFGRKQKWEYNGFEAFVTFFHPSSKYSGPGTDGTFSREVILTSYPLG